MSSVCTSEDEMTSWSNRKFNVYVNSLSLDVIDIEMIKVTD